MRLKKISSQSENLTGRFAGRSLAVSESPAAAAPSSTLVFGSSFVALAPGPAPVTTPLPRLPTDISPTSPSQNTSLSLIAALSANSTALAQSTTTVDVEYCALPACGVNCIEFSLASTSQLNNHFYAQTGSTTCDFGFQTQYECCIQTCSADTDCLAGYYCQSGSAAGSVCTLCEACGVTTSAQCMAALNCQSSCCLNPSRDSCYIPGLGGITQISVFDAETCCPTSPSTYAFSGQACGCGTTPQLCPAFPPPEPQQSPSSSPELQLLLSVPPPPSPPPVVSHMTVNP